MAASARSGPGCCGPPSGACVGLLVRVPPLQGMLPRTFTGTVLPASDNKGSDMILSTMNDLPGYEVTEVIGEVFGITVRSRNIGSSLGASFKSLVGGELRGMTKLLSASRTEAQDRLIGAGQADSPNPSPARRVRRKRPQN